MVKKKFTTTKIVKGRTYQYFRRDGKYIRLPDDPSSEEYDREYWAQMRGKGSKENKLTFDRLILSYKQSPKWEKLAPRTKKDYSRVLKYLHEVIGSKDPTKMRRSHVIEAQVSNKHRARFANYIVHMLSILLEHAIDLDWQRENSARGVSKLKTGEGFKPWPDWEIDIYRKNAMGNDLLALELAIGTGQRISDILKMKWSDIDEHGVNVVQGKTGYSLWIPFTRQLDKFLTETKRHGFTIMSDNHGRPLLFGLVQKRCLRLRRKLGLEEYHIHGWRYTAASDLAATGATDSEIAAITGHRSLEMVAKYSRKNNQKLLAKNAQKRRK